MAISPSNGHLGTSWEIAIVVVFVCLVVALLSAFVFQVRRKRREKRQRALEQQADVEKGEGGGRKSGHANGKRIKVSTEQTHSQDSEERGSPPSTRESISESPRTNVDVGVTGPPASDEELAKPPPVAQTKRISKSSPHEYIAKKPPKYYWDQR